MVAVAKVSNTAHKADVSNAGVILNVPGAPLSATAPAMSEGTVNNTLRHLLVTRNEEPEQQLRGLRFLLK